jgi:succinate dehydrogenase/fumarate reductase flavoprotein subunit
VWVDCRGAPEELIKDMRHFTTQEANEAFWDYMDKEGIDVREHPIEFTEFAMLADHGGTVISDKCETTVPGLFAVQGGNALITMGAASNLGWIAGEAMAKYAKEAPPSKLEDVRVQIGEKRRQAADMLCRETGAEWKEGNIALQCVMRDYCGEVRSEPMLTTGLTHLGRVRQKTLETMKAENAHELMRCHEVLNLMDLGEIVFLCSLERKETRGRHKRADYPYTNPYMKKYLIIKQVEGKPVFDWEDLGNAWTRPCWE